MNIKDLSKEEKELICVSLDHEINRLNTMIEDNIFSMVNLKNDFSAREYYSNLAARTVVLLCMVDSCEKMIKILRGTKWAIK